MKIKRVYILLLIFAFFIIGMPKVFAKDFGTDWASIGCEASKNCIPLCRYSLKRFVEFDTSLNRVYKYASVYIFYQNGINVSFSPFNEDDDDDNHYGPYRMLGDNSNIIYYLFVNDKDDIVQSRLDQWSKDNFTCPDYAYVDTMMDETYANSFVKVCFDDDGESCQRERNTFSSIFDLINDTDRAPTDNNVKDIVENNYRKVSLGTDILRSYTCDMFNNDNKLLDNVNVDLGNHLISRFIRDFKEDYDTMIMNNDIYKLQFYKLRGAIIRFSNKCIEEINSSSLTEDEKNKKLDGLTFTMDELDATLKKGVLNSSGKPYVPSCSSILPDDVSTTLKNILNLIKYIGPVLVAVLTIADLIKASVSGDDGEVKKVSQKFIKRLIAASLLFFIPVILNIIFDLFGITIPRCFN